MIHQSDKIGEVLGGRSTEHWGFRDKTCLVKYTTETNTTQVSDVIRELHSKINQFREVPLYFTSRINLRSIS